MDMFEYRLTDAGRAAARLQAETLKKLKGFAINPTRERELAIAAKFRNIVLPCRDRPTSSAPRCSALNFSNGRAYDGISAIVLTRL